jgi:hypothetical protein
VVDGREWPAERPRAELVRERERGENSIEWDKKLEKIIGNDGRRSGKGAGKKPGKRKMKDFFRVGAGEVERLERLENLDGLGF